MNSRLTDWIWKIDGTVALPSGQSVDEAFARLDPLFRERGTSRERDGNSLSFTKKDPDAQDKMAVFDRGELRIEQDETGPVLRYRLVSRTLLYCFLAPLLFLSFAGLTMLAAKYERPPTEEQKKKEEARKERVLPQHPIDKFLGAPAPEKPKKDEKKKDEPFESDLKPTSAYVFAGIFAILFLVGRWLEDYLIRSEFRKKLQVA